MRKYNLSRPLLIIAVALFTKTATTTICLLLGTSEETADNISFGVMLIAVFIAYSRLNKSRKKR